MAEFEYWVFAVRDGVWGVPLLVLLGGTHLFLTVRLRFPQRYIGRAIKISFSRQREGEGDISQFGALTTALAATVGTGNIVGVATAVSAGGPGAVLWMWLTGVFGISTKYAEALLAVKYRVSQPDGQMAGGPMYVLERGLGARWLGVCFAVFCALAAFGIGNLVQANSIASLARESYGLSPLVVGALLALAAGAVILGGIKQIARVCQALVPFMALLYLGGCLVLLFVNLEGIPHSLALIVNGAFSGQAALGGFMGAGVKEAVRYGVARGLFSNESGLGSAPIVAAAAQTRDPVRQALVSSSGTFWDTVVICAITGLVLVNSGCWHEGLKDAALTRAAFSVLDGFGPLILNVGLLTFVFSTILGWAYYGEKAVEYLLGRRAVLAYRILWTVMVFVGAQISLNLVWALADIANALMALPNLIALLLLQRVVVEETSRHLWQ